MKKTWKTILSLACAFALILSLGAGALAVTDEDLARVEALAQRAVDIQAVENIMSRHVMYHCYGEHREEMENIWVQEPENQATASFGQNAGFYVGYATIWDAYVTEHDTTWMSSIRNYLEYAGIDASDMTEEELLDIYGGVGQLILHVTTTAMIEIADDGQTARGFWYSPGMIADANSSLGAVSCFEAYGVDFVKEEDGWKIWHLHMFTDFMGSFYVDLGSYTGSSASGEASGSGEASDSETAAGAQGDVAELDEFTRHEYLSSPQYTQLSKSRLRSEMEVIPFPMPYESWSFDEPNFGPTVEEYESLGIDLDAWYAAHSS